MQIAATASFVGERSRNVSSANGDSDAPKICSNSSSGSKFRRWAKANHSSVSRAVCRYFSRVCRRVKLADYNNQVLSS